MNVLACVRGESSDYVRWTSCALIRKNRRGDGALIVAPTRLNVTTCLH